MATSIINTKIGEARKVSRVWLEGQKLARAGIQIGTRYALHVQSEFGRAELRPVPTDYVGDTFRVVKREKFGVVSPLIEIRTNLLSKLFGLAAKIRVVVRDARILITRCHVDLKVAERVKRFLEKLKSGSKLSTVSLFHGGGVIDRAIHSGLQRAGVGSYVKVGVEQEGKYLDSSLRNNPEIWGVDSISICGDIRDVNLVGCGNQEADVLIAGIPCNAASVAGRAKQKLSMPESHPDVGALFHYTLKWIEVFNPALVLLENVLQYQNTASMAVIRSVLQQLGYVVKEAVMKGGEYALEDRDRLVVVATTPGIADLFSFDNVVPLQPRPANLKAVIEDIPLDSPRWKAYDYLAAKEERDIADGKTFYRQLLTGEEVSCGTVGKGYARARSTEPFLIHPENPALSRLLTPREHAALKGIPVAVIAGNADTVAQEIAGQSGIYPLFEAIAFAVGMTIQYDLNFGSLESYCQQVCGGGECGTEKLCAVGVDAQTQMPDMAAWIAAHANDYLAAA
jgi:DNA (cytosine-5)-methyltransferase 1